MRVFLGMILGALLTVAVAYVHDSMGNSPETTGTSGRAASEQQMIVNWKVVEARLREFKTGWSAVKSRAHEGWIKISASFPK
ncbi:MAG: hypothetical protein HY659_09340 [Rhizobiales bacterium]|nr:hypothetical protein [Hyphomicrobiales bacterium]